MVPWSANQVCSIGVVWLDQQREHHQWSHFSYLKKSCFCFQQKSIIYFQFYSTLKKSLKTIRFVSKLHYGRLCSKKCKHIVKTLWTFLQFSFARNGVHPQIPCSRNSAKLRNQQSWPVSVLQPASASLPGHSIKYVVAKQVVTRNIIHYCAVHKNESLVNLCNTSSECKTRFRPF